MTYQFRSLLDPEVAHRSLVSLIKIDDPIASKVMAPLESRLLPHAA